MTMPRVRVVSYLVQPHLVLDDGDTLTPLAVQPITVTAADWPQVQEMCARAIEALQAQLGATGAIPA